MLGTARKRHPPFCPAMVLNMMSFNQDQYRMFAVSRKRLGLAQNDYSGTAARSRLRLASRARSSRTRAARAEADDHRE